ncbi:hypothetical protein [Trueperella bernardiae]|uniref:hypothetical protein n=1 Tax=Trueperella bernardiae TaxID=59561 RepID=UPI002889CF39|nr:hypothetical protein [Trueperella bernardiae]
MTDKKDGHWGMSYFADKGGKATGKADDAARPVCDPAAPESPVKGAEPEGHWGVSYFASKADEE